jgi:hypothetical protein
MPKQITLRFVVRTLARLKDAMLAAEETSRGRPQVLQQNLERSGLNSRAVRPSESDPKLEFAPRFKREGA